MQQPLFPFDSYTNPALADVANTGTGEKIWAALCSPRGVAAMEEASQRGEPAVSAHEEGLRELLEGDRLYAQDPERLKMLCLNMAKQIMELRGWEHSACRLSPQRFFSSSGVFCRCTGGTVSP